jgi:hypothetical protein
MERMKPEDEGDKPKIEKSTRTKKTKKIKVKDLEVSNYIIIVSAPHANVPSIPFHWLLKLQSKSILFTRVSTSTPLLVPSPSLRSFDQKFQRTPTIGLMCSFKSTKDVISILVDKVTKKSNRIIIINDTSCKKWNTCSADDEEPSASLGFQVSQSLSSIQNALSSTLLSRLHQTKHLPSTRNPCYPIPAALRQMFDASSPTLNPLPTGHLTVDSSLRPLFSFPSALSSTSPSRLHHLPLT